MLINKAVGRHGSTRKYDVLSVLGAHGLAGGKTGQRLALRLICLITARYNWQTDELSVGQAEIARLWSVDVRTVKREMAELRGRGWLVEKRAAARGRVTRYGLGLARIMADTRADWPNVGIDLVARLEGEGAAEAEQTTNVVPFPTAGAAPDHDTLWGHTKARLREEGPTVYAAWIAGLEWADHADGTVDLRAPSSFHASYVSTHLAADILRALRRFDPAIALLRVR